jgi:hypothetical protein
LPWLALAEHGEDWQRESKDLSYFSPTFFYFVYELIREPTKSYAGISNPHWLNAAMGMIILGLPGLYVMLRGTYPAWGIGARGFNRDADSPSDAKSPEGDDPKSW